MAFMYVVILKATCTFPRIFILNMPHHLLAEAMACRCAVIEDLLLGIYAVRCMDYM